MSNDLERYVTPVGELVGFVHLNKPDLYEGVSSYKAVLALDPNDPGVDAFLQQLHDAAVAQHSKVCEDLKAKGGKHIHAAQQTDLYEPVEDEYNDDGTPTGRSLIRVKAKADYVRSGKQVDVKLDFVDSKRKKIHDVPLIYRGTKAAIAGVICPFYNPAVKNAGVSLRIYGVQIVDLVTGGSGGGGDLGFGDVDGGYTSDAEEYADAYADFTEEDY